MARLLDAATHNSGAAIQLAIGVAVGVALLLTGPPASDPLLFIPYADRVLGGAMPYRDYALEYPPLALLPIVLPRLAAPTADGYQTLFSVLSLVLACGLGVVLVWLARRGWSAGTPRETLITYVSLGLASAPLVIWRFDILPALLTSLALVGVAARRPAWAGAALGLGAVAKIYPALLMPVVIVFYLANRQVKSAGLLVVGFTVAAGVVLAPFVLFAGSSAFSFLGYQNARGVEMESVLAGIVLLAHTVTGAVANVNWGFGSFQVASPLIQSLAIPFLATEVALLFGLLAGGAFSFRSDAIQFGSVRPRTLINYLLATLLLAIIVNKVLSPQYIVWLLPFGALLPWRQSLVLLIAFALTTVVYPLGFNGLVSLDPAMIFILNIRNLVLVGLFVWLMVPERLQPRPTRRPRSLQTRSTRSGSRSTQESSRSTTSDPAATNCSPISLRSASPAPTGRGNGADSLPPRLPSPHQERA